MNEKIQAYKKRLEKQLNSVERVIALKERSRSRVLEKLKDVEDSYQRELGRGAVKVSQIEGVAPTKKPKTILKKNVGVNDKIEIPTIDMNLPAPAPAAATKEKEKEKSKLTFW